MERGVRPTSAATSWMRRSRGSSDARGWVVVTRPFYPKVDVYVKVVTGASGPPGPVICRECALRARLAIALSRHAYDAHEGAGDRSGCAYDARLGPRRRPAPGQVRIPCARRTGSARAAASHERD